MTNSFSVSPVFPWWIIVLVIVPLFLFLTWKEIRRKQKFLLLRLTAQFLIMISLLGILLKPAYITEKKSTGIMLLTPGYNPAQADSLLNLFPDLRVLRVTAATAFRNSEILASDYSLTTLDHEVQFVLGEGLPAHLLELMDKKTFQFLPAPLPAGIVQLHISEAKVNQNSRINGTINTTGKTTVFLQGPGGIEDSLVIDRESTAPFSLRFKPRQAGRFVYTMAYRDNSGTHREQLPIEVMPEEKLSVLFLQKFPGFEVRQLKNMMAEQGHRLALRYQVSKSDYRFEFANLPSLRLAPVTSSLLESFDLVVLDDDALETLATTEKNILEESIHQGLGMILLSNRTSEKDRLRDRFLPLELRKTLKDTAQLSFSTRRYTLPVLTLQTTENPVVYPVLKNGSRVLSAYTYAGFGKVGFQFLQETYRLALEGNTADYASIWSPLLEKIARQKNERFKIQPQYAFPVYPDETLHVEIISNVEEHPALKNDEANVPLTEHVMIDNTWLGKVWAGNPGWHRFSVDSTAAYYFVSESSAWRSLQTANQIRENEKVTVHVTKVSQPEIISHRKVISNLIFYLIFLFASGFLWLAPKI